MSSQEGRNNTFINQVQQVREKDDQRGRSMRDVRYITPNSGHLYETTNWSSNVASNSVKELNDEVVSE